MATAYGTIPRPSQADARALAGMLPLEDTLRDDTSVLVLHISAVEAEDDGMYAALVSRMYKLFKAEIEDGNSYPQEELLDEAAFRAYFLAYDAFIAVQLSDAEADQLGEGTSVWDQDLLGFFYVKPNFPGRCSHICNGGFFTAPQARNRGVGRFMGEAFLKVAPALGYKAAMFNLVFVNNTASVKLWRSLGFRELGRIPKAGRLRSSPELVDAIMFHYDFTT